MTMPIKKSYGMVVVRPDGHLPIPVALSKDLDLNDGDLAGLRRMTRGRWELTFWRKIRVSSDVPAAPDKLPEFVGFLRKPER